MTIMDGYYFTMSIKPSKKKNRQVFAKPELKRKRPKKKEL